jgi:hypothetical protein
MSLELQHFDNAFANGAFSPAIHLRLHLLGERLQP